VSRTYRNRHAVPAAFEVRDGGRVCRRGARTGLFASFPDYSAWAREKRRIQPAPFRTRLYGCEDGEARRIHRRWYRRTANVLVHERREEEVPPFRGTSGWLTW
jgi:hypothetical protein